MTTEQEIADIRSDMIAEFGFAGDRMERIEAKLDRVLSTMENTESLIQKVVAEVKPAIDEFMNSSFFKMLNMGKKK